MVSVYIVVILLKCTGCFNYSSNDKDEWVISIKVMLRNQILYNVAPLSEILDVLYSTGLILVSFQLLDHSSLWSVHKSTCTSNMKTCVSMTLMSFLKFSPASSTVKMKQCNATFGCEKHSYNILIVLFCRTWETLKSAQL